MYNNNLIFNYSIELEFRYNKFHDLVQCYPFLGKTKTGRFHSDNN